MGLMYISPCVQICQIDKETRLCKGCGRTIDEIREWTRYTEEERMVVMRRLGYGRRKKHRNTNRK
jgi:predicted Fe-S protein YdhL (DUF1289 family)